MESKMSDLMKKYPGTVIAVLDKSDPDIRVKMKDALMLAQKEWEKTLYERLLEKKETYGTAVSCSTPEGYIVEGNIVEILPWGCEWFDEKWNDVTIVVKGHDSKRISNWRPDYVTFIGKS